MVVAVPPVRAHFGYKQPERPPTTYPRASLTVWCLSSTQFLTVIPTSPEQTKSIDDRLRRRVESALFFVLHEIEKKKLGQIGK